MLQVLFREEVELWRRLQVGTLPAGREMARAEVLHQAELAKYDSMQADRR